MLTDFCSQTCIGGELYKMLNDCLSFFVLYLREQYTDHKGDKAEWTLKANAYLRFCASLQPVFLHIYIPINALIPAVFIHYILLLTQTVTAFEVPIFHKFFFLIAHN